MNMINNKKKYKNNYNNLGQMSFAKRNKQKNRNTMNY